MKLNFKNTLIATSIAAGLFGASAFAVAQTADSKATTAAATTTEMQAQHTMQRSEGKGDSQGKHRMERMAKMQKHMAERQAQLKAALKLAPEQEAGWNAFVARTAPEPHMGGKDGAQHEDWSKLTTPERLDKMQARHAERSEHMAKRIDATKSFYATLTPEQQKTFDSQSMRGFQRAGMQHGGEHEMGKHGHKHGGKDGKGMEFKKGQQPSADMPAKQG